MANDYFEFKQFVVRQEKCAMKVGTDGVVLGAWAETGEVARILDVGAGTGLIALMLAQRSNALIDGIEIDFEASEQAKENCLSSNWGERIHIINDSLQNYIKYSENKFDLIVSNPPYFTNGVKSNNAKRAVARHSDELSILDLVEGSSKLLSSEGRLCVILPVEQRKDFLGEITKHKLWLLRELYVKPSKDKKAVRILMEVGKVQNSNVISSELIVSLSGTNSHTDEFKKLTKNYYLYM